MKKVLLTLLMRYLIFILRVSYISFALAFISGIIISLIYKEIADNISGLIMTEFNLLFISIVSYLVHYKLNKIGLPANIEQDMSEQSEASFVDKSSKFIHDIKN